MRITHQILHKKNHSKFDYTATVTDSVDNARNITVTSLQFLSRPPSARPPTGFPSWPVFPGSPGIPWDAKKTPCWRHDIVSKYNTKELQKKLQFSGQWPFWLLKKYFTQKQTRGKLMADGNHLRAVTASFTSLASVSFITSRASNTLWDTRYKAAYRAETAIWKEKQKRQRNACVFGPLLLKVQSQ